MPVEINKILTFSVVNFAVNVEEKSGLVVGKDYVLDQKVQIITTTMEVVCEMANHCEINGTVRTGIEMVIPVNEVVKLPKIVRNVRGMS